MQEEFSVYLYMPCRDTRYALPKVTAGRLYKSNPQSRFMVDIIIDKSLHTDHRSLSSTLKKLRSSFEVPPKAGSNHENFLQRGFSTVAMHRYNSAAVTGGAIDIKSDLTHRQASSST